MNRWIAGLALLLVFSTSLAAGASAQSRIVTLEWTAPGDDAYVGRSTTYDIRFSRSPISQSNFLAATKLNIAILPGAAGSKEHLTVVGLTQGVGYYFAMRSLDDGGNLSQVSNIAYLAGNVAGVDAVYAPPEFSAPKPNPALGSTQFAVTLPRPEWLRVEAFDVAGRKVRTLAMGQYSAGHFNLRWDLRDDSGQRLDPGAYMVRSQVGDAVFLRRVVVVG